MCVQGGNNIKKDMRQAILIVALVCIAFAGVLPQSAQEILEHTPNPNAILRQVKFEPLNYCDPEVEVKITEITIGWHGVAYSQYLALYPAYHSYLVTGCRYSTLGVTRFYTFIVTVSGTPKKCSTAIQVEDESAATTTSIDLADGFSQVSVTWAQQDPLISFAVNVVIKSNWDSIKGNPLDACWTRQISGVWEYRFYFKNVNGRFEYSQKDKSTDGQVETKPASYFADVEPVFVAGDVAQYKSFDLDSFKKTSEYSVVVAQLTKSLGSFNEKWILDVSISISAGVNYIKVTINFQPLLVKQTYEAQYFGSIEKAALLKIDEQVFNANGKSYQNWQEIKEFGSLNDFRFAAEYAQSQFTWLRFYAIVSAYSALHLKGRYVRLVYQGIVTYVDPNNQINIVIFIDECGRYFIDRNDFLATNLNSYGRNNWVSLFIHTPDVSKAKFYQQIVKFYQAIYPKFWSANQLVDIKFKGDLHIVKFTNPTHESISCLNVNGERVDVLNNFNWIHLGDNSPLVGRIENIVRGKNTVSSIVFIQFLESKNGTHFEIGYLDDKKDFHTTYLLYIPANDAFTDDNAYAFNSKTYESDTFNNPLPKDLNLSILSFLQQTDFGVVAVISYVVLAPRLYSVIAVVNGSRWEIVINWASQTWSIVSKQPAGDGFYPSHGVPSSSAAACTGFLRRLYPHHFAVPFVYVLIETKTVGIVLYNRIIVTFGVASYEGVVSSTFGIRNSEVLQSWRPVLFVRPSNDYGYGKDYKINYGVPASYLYVEESKPSNLSSEPEKPATEPIPAAAVEPTPAGCPAGTKNILGACIPTFQN